MIKSYRGYALPTNRQVAYALEYLCPQCKSGDVALDESVTQPTFYDGGPSLGDSLSSWKCNACSHQGAGKGFVVRLIEDENQF